jgi:predicted RNA-binding protein YlqC (UPF0109 family)
MSGPVATPHELANLLLPLVRLYVRAPDAVRIEAVPAAGITALLIHTDPGDVGRVVGSEGHRIGLLRDLVADVAAALDLGTVVLDVAGSYRSNPSQRLPGARAR